MFADDIVPDAGFQTMEHIGFASGKESAGPAAVEQQQQNLQVSLVQNQTTPVIEDSPQITRFNGMKDKETALLEDEAPRYVDESGNGGVTHGGGSGSGSSNGSGSGTGGTTGGSGNNGQNQDVGGQNPSSITDNSSNDGGENPNNNGAQVTATDSRKLTLFGFTMLKEWWIAIGSALAVLLYILLRRKEV